MKEFRYHAEVPKGFTGTCKVSYSLIEVALYFEYIKFHIGQEAFFHTVNELYPFSWATGQKVLKAHLAAKGLLTIEEWLA